MDKDKVNYTAARLQVDVSPSVVHIASRFAASFFWWIATFGVDLPSYLRRPFDCAISSPVVPSKIR
jgi:hypothetical protein